MKKKDIGEMLPGGKLDKEIKGELMFGGFFNMIMGLVKGINNSNHNINDNSNNNNDKKIS
jgi:hypothetical protein